MKQTLTEEAMLRKMLELQAAGKERVTAGEMAKFFRGGSIKFLCMMLRCERQLRREENEVKR